MELRTWVRYASRDDASAAADELERLLSALGAAPEDAPGAATA
jgi:hypothetical protein